MQDASPAIVLRSVDFQESSRIVTLFTREWGKIAVMARGCRNPKSKFAGQLEAGNLIDVMVSLKPGRSIQTLTDSSYRHPTWSIRADFGRLALSMAYLELCDQHLADEQPMSDWFGFSEQMLIWLNIAPADVHPAYVFPYLQVRVVDFLGYGLTIEHDDPRWFRIEDGVLGASAESGMAFRLTDGQARYLATAVTSRRSSLFRPAMPASELRQLLHHLDVYIRHHTHITRERRSDTLLLQTLE